MGTLEKNILYMDNDSVDFIGRNQIGEMRY
jgi:hypothetical protein